MRANRRRMVLVGRGLPRVETRTTAKADWQEASPAWIDRALERNRSRPSGGWYVVDASRVIDAPKPYRILGQDLVAWRAEDRLLVAPDRCPHLGARLSEGRVCQGRLACPWHDLHLGPEGHGPWRPLPARDDGVLLWVQLADGESPSAAPCLPERPTHFIEAVLRMEAACEARDVIENRLDPWHGVHFHPHSFGRLTVIDQQPDEITVRVAYRIVGPVAMEVDARFHCPDARTIVMTIVHGDGEGSVVETHATPIDEGRTAIIEATLASSDRPGFSVARRAAWLLRPFLERAARRLWVEDAAYAERRFELRMRQRAEAAAPPRLRLAP